MLPDLPAAPSRALRSVFTLSRISTNSFLTFRTSDASSVGRGTLPCTRGERCVCVCVIGTDGH